MTDSESMLPHDPGGPTRPDDPNDPGLEDPDQPGVVPGAFPAVGEQLVIRRRGYVLTDSQDRTWLAFEPEGIIAGGVMPPLAAGATAKVTQQVDDGVKLLGSDGATTVLLDGYLLPARLVPTGIRKPS